jgi:hypothetical protein
MTPPHKPECVCICHSTDKEGWREKVRLDYKGILSDEIILSTIKYWEGIIAVAVKEAEARGYERGFIESSQATVGDFNAGIEACLEVIEKIPDTEPKFESDEYDDGLKSMKSYLISHLKDIISKQAKHEL